MIAIFFTMQQDALSMNKQSLFYDVTAREKSKDVVRSPIIQLYCGSHNIGDYLPVLGIKQMIKQNIDLDTDTYAIRSRVNKNSKKTTNVDFDFINQHYKVAIMGGAGLFHKIFQPFWEEALDKCKIPMIIWGIGLCLPETKEQFSSGVDKNIIQAVAQKCALINLRDSFTAQYYGLEHAHISLCPSVIYIKRFLPQRFLTGGRQTLYVSHQRLVPEEISKKIGEYITKHSHKSMTVNHIFGHANTQNLDELMQHYCASNLVITSRLHGAIIAYALQIPYVIIAYDEKLRAFQREYGNGILIKDFNDLPTVLNDTSWRSSQIKKPRHFQPVIAFGHKACAYIKKLML